MSGEPERPAKLEPLQMFNGKQDAKNLTNFTCEHFQNGIVCFSLIKKGGQLRTGYDKYTFPGRLSARRRILYTETCGGEGLRVFHLKTLSAGP